MNVEKIVQLIVMVCEVIVQRSGGSGLEARVAKRIQEEVSPLLPSGHQALPLKRLEAGNSATKGSRS